MIIAASVFTIFFIGFMFGTIKRDKVMFELWWDSERRAQMYFNRLMGWKTIRRVK